jgi:hypothetical protein
MPDAPAAALTTPVAEAPIPDLVNNILGGKQYISPSYWLGWAMDKVCGVNPFDWAAEQFAGDWNAAAEASSALNNLAEFNTRYGDTLKQAAGNLIPHEWDGNAAAHAQTYFNQLATDLQKQVSALKDIASQFRSLAAGMEEMAQALQSILQDLLDWLIAIGISAAAATAASIWEAVEVWYLALDAHDAAWAAVQAFTGLCAGYLGAIHGMDKVSLPGAGYDHPGV